MKPKLELKPHFDASSSYGARVLADHIVAVWRARGVRVAAERYQVTETTWGIRSNLVDGLPPLRGSR